MNIQLTAYGLGGGYGGAGGGSYDDTAIKQELVRIKQALAALPSGAAYDDTDLRKQIAAVAEQVSKIADTRKEYQAAYVPKEDFLGKLEAAKYVTVKFKKPFSKVPFVKVTFDIKSTRVRLGYIANATETDFNISTDYIWDLYGIWYEAYLID